MSNPNNVISLFFRAKILTQFKNPAGDTVINMTDPWGNNLQVIHRVKPKL